MNALQMVELAPVHKSVQTTLDHSCAVVILVSCSMDTAVVVSALLQITHRFA